MIEAAKTLLDFLWSAVNTNFISSFLGGFLAVVIFWKIFEQKIKSSIEFNERKKLAQKFLLELLYNRIVASKVVESETKYMNSNEFTFLKYETTHTENFLLSQPINLGKEFYAELGVLISGGFRKDNMLLDIFWFSPEATEIDRRNYKRVFISNAKNNVVNIDKILGDERFQSAMRRLGLADDWLSIDS